MKEGLKEFRWHLEGLRELLLEAETDAFKYLLEHTIEGYEIRIYNDIIAYKALMEHLKDEKGRETLGLAYDRFVEKRGGEPPESWDDWVRPGDPTDWIKEPEEENQNHSE